VTRRWSTWHGWWGQARGRYSTVLPGAAAWVINGLKMSLPYALIGVIVG
jgi:ABC-type nitrate/sulfonate/bicarbonate transport system permease component